MIKKYFITWMFVILVSSFTNSFASIAPGDTTKYKTVFGEPWKMVDTVSIEAGDLSSSDDAINDLLTDKFAIISKEWVSSIKNTRFVKPTDSVSGSFSSVSYLIPKNFLVDTAKILWELNIPEFKSRLYQLYNGDTIYIDTWNNVVGKSATKTYAGHFEAFRLRNWPSWKDPEKPESVATPPGPKNPLGLFVVHYDEKSLRYFHGTNRNSLIYSSMRNLSHGCVRNDNDNIQKMKEFICKRVIKTDNLNYWLDSKRSMTYEIHKADRFPVRIVYRTFTVFKDDKGTFLELYSDVYGYNKYNDRSADDDCVILTNKENIKNEYRRIIKNGLSEDKLDLIIDYVLANGDRYEKYYFKDIEALVGK